MAVVHHVVDLNIRSIVTFTAWALLYFSVMTAYFVCSFLVFIHLCTISYTSHPHVQL